MKKLQLLFISAVVFVFGFMLMEGTMVKAATTATAAFNVNVTVGKEIAITCTPATSTMPNSIGTISGMTGGTVTSTAVNTFWCNTITNSQEGYTLGVQATTTGALMKLNGIGEHFEDIAATRYNLDLQTAENLFGFSASTTREHLLQAYRSTTSCNQAAGVSSLEHCWTGFNGATIVPVVDSSVNTGTGGEHTDFGFIAGVGPTAFQVSGLYNAHVIVTATVK